MSKIALSPDASGTGTFTLASPNSNTNRTLTLPDAAGELLTSTGDGSQLTGVSAYKPVNVTGATQSLDISSGSFFVSSAMTAATTVSFANVPTDANWRYSFEPSAGTGFDIEAADLVKTYDQAQDSTPEGVEFKPDGTKMYVAGDTNDSIFEYDLSTPWSVTSATFLQGFSVSSQNGSVQGVRFKTDGTEMYVVGYSASEVNQYSLSTAWDISSASFTRFFDLISQERLPSGLFFKPDGAKMYIVGFNLGGDVFEYDLSTPWNISTASFLQTLDVGSGQSRPYDMAFKPDGTHMFLVGQIGNLVIDYTLSTPWDISTATLSVSQQLDNPVGLFIRADGLKMYVASTTGDVIYEYDIAAGIPVTFPLSLDGTLSPLRLNTRATYEFRTADSGTTVDLISEEVIVL